MSLSVSRLIRMVVSLSPTGAARRSFGILNIAGDSNVISGLERTRTYITLEDVATDFGTTAPEYLAASLYFGQTPRPQTLQISRYLRTASNGYLLGGVLTAAEQAMSNFTSITNGGFKVTIDGVLKSLTGLDFSAQTNLNGVASVINVALTGGTVTFTGSQFKITSATTGVTSTVSFAIAPVSGTDISTLLKLTSVTASPLVPGYAAETPVQCATALANKSPSWYGLMFAASVQPTDTESVAVSAYIEGLTIKRIFGATITSTTVLDSGVTNDLASQLKALGYKRSFTQYSQNLYAVASMFGREFSVNFDGNKTTITLMYKQEPGVAAEELTEAQANVLQDKRCNVFVNYVNDTSIIQYGTMAGTAYIDEIHGLDWLEDAIQNSCYNILYTSTTKIPQTDAGVNQIVSGIAAACDQGVNNGLIAPGIWNADGFGELSRGQFMKTGYYIYAQPIALQAQADRELRKAPPIRTAIKLAGAIQELDIQLDVNR